MKKTTLISSLAAAVAATVGIVTPIYSDIPWAVSQMKGQDAITIPAALLLFLTSRMKSHAEIITATGLHAYLVYTYLFYALETRLNPLFHLYLIIALSSSLGLANGIMELKHKEKRNIQRSGTLPGVIYLSAVGLILAILWNADILGNLMGSPLLPNPSGEPLTIVYVFDLTFVIPAILYTLLLLKKGEAFGGYLLGVMLIKASTMGAALLGMVVGLAVCGMKFDVFLAGFWGFLSIAGLGCLGLYFRSLSAAPFTPREETQ